MAAHRPLRSDFTQARGAGYIKQLDTLDGKEELYYLITNAEAILFDTQAPIPGSARLQGTSQRNQRP